MAFWGWDQGACRHAFEGSGVGLKFVNVIVPVIVEGEQSRRDAKPALTKAEETAKKNIFLFLRNLASFAPLRLAPWNTSSTENISVSP